MLGDMNHRTQCNCIQSIPIVSVVQGKHSPASCCCC
jgi:hypothetical protein